MLQLQKMSTIVIILSLSTLLVYAASTASGDQVATNDIPTCNEKDENINECLSKLFAQMIPRSKNGIPELNIPAMDPFTINRTSYIFSHALFDGKVSARNLKIHGLSTAKTEKVDFKRNGNRTKLSTTTYIPKIFIEGMYKAKIRFNTANISSKGPFNVTFTNISVNTEAVSDLYERDGHVYMRLKSYNFDPTVGNMIFHADGLVPEPLLNDAILEFINQNWSSIYKSLIPETRAAWEPEFIKIGNAYFSQVPIDAVLKSE